MRLAQHTKCSGSSKLLKYLLSCAYPVHHFVYRLAGTDNLDCILSAESCGWPMRLLQGPPLLTGISYTDPAWLSLTNERKFVDQQQQINER